MFEQGLREHDARVLIGVKRVGELDERPFKRLCSRKAEEENVIKLVSLWEKHLRDPSWHPFKVITVDGNIQVIHTITLVHVCT